jgi:uncharacterized LabA/DUF88 family protein
VRGLRLSNAKFRTALLIDGGALRVHARITEKPYSGDFVEDFAYKCIDEAREHLLRILYYDAPLFDGDVTRPISRTTQTFTGGTGFLDDLATRDRFAVRRGSLSFRGWKPNRWDWAEGEAPEDEDFDPIFEQKGVDMRIGLDIASFAERRTIDRLLLISSDNDMVAALKYARRAGIEVGVVQLPEPSWPLSRLLQAHSDFVREIG